MALAFLGGIIEKLPFRNVVRHKVLVEGQSQRAVARELGLAPVTVRKYLDQGASVRAEAAPRPRTVLGGGRVRGVNYFAGRQI